MCTCKWNIWSRCSSVYLENSCINARIKKVLFFKLLEKFFNVEETAASREKPFSVCWEHVSIYNLRHFTGAHWAMLHLRFHKKQKQGQIISVCQFKTIPYNSQIFWNVCSWINPCLRNKHSLICDVLFCSCCWLSWVMFSSHLVIKYFYVKLPNSTNNCNINNSILIISYSKQALRQLRKFDLLVAYFHILIGKLVSTFLHFFVLQRCATPLYIHK